jgi:high-affinity Fe2+/Pb2+ permease
MNNEQQRFKTKCMFFYAAISLLFYKGLNSQEESKTAWTGYLKQRLQPSPNGDTKDDPCAMGIVCFILAGERAVVRQ